MLKLLTKQSNLNYSETCSIRVKISFQVSHSLKVVIAIYDFVLPTLSELFNFLMTAHEMHVFILGFAQ